jgi:tRNA (guanine-N7-)-methyltransferase
VTADDDSQSDDANPPRRKVRSFVVRSGRATIAQQRALAELWPVYGLELGPGPLDWNAAFGRSAPRMMEIGFGAGEALLEFAHAHPEFDCLGVEVHRPGVGRLLLGAEAAQLKNLRVLCHDAVEILQSHVAPASFSLVHIFFPDPWPKKRHHKRRLIQAPFVQLLARALQPEGVLRLATDWEPYAIHMREIVDACSEFANVATDAGFVARSAARPLTRFERRGQRLGHRVWDLEYRKKK